MNSVGEKCKGREEFAEFLGVSLGTVDNLIKTGELKPHRVLDWSQVDLERRIIWITRSKHGKGRYVRLNSQAIEAFEELLRRNEGQKRGRVFADVTLTDAQRHEWFNNAIKEAGIEDFRWHDLRHSFASRLVMSGVSLRSVQELMGHKSIQMTCRYAHLAPAVEQEAVESMGAEWLGKVLEAETKASALVSGGAA